MIRSAALLLLALPAMAQAATPPCPPQPLRVVRSTGTATDYLGAVPGLPALCRMARPDGSGDYYYGVWKTDWPGAGEAYPALYTVLTGPKGSKAHFITRSVPGLQWVDTFTNEGLEPLQVAGKTVQTLRLAHERDGIEGNTYHSIITSWRDVTTGATLKTVENQISGQSYGPATTWQATSIKPLTETR